MLAVSDTSPISNLAAIGILELLKSQFSTIWIPGAVEKELDDHPDPAAHREIKSALTAKWIQVCNPENGPLLRLLSSQLHRGEAEAIALAAELGADFVLIDEQEARVFATKAGLAVTGVLGILLRAKSMGHLTAVKPAIQLLRSKAGFFVSSALESKVLAAAGE